MGGSSVLNLDVAALGEPSFVETIDYEAILARRKAKLIALFPAAAGFLNLEGEPLTYLLEEASYTETLLRQRINDAYKQSLLPFATRSDLDYVAGFWGITRLVGEDDERLRRRAWLGIIGRSVGGTAERYRFVALGASTEVKDAICWCDGLSPLVHVAVVSTAAGGVAGPALLALVHEALTAADVRLVNDTISVVAAVAQSVNITADLWALPGSDGGPELVARVTSALRAAWDKEGGLGRDLVRSFIVARMMISGVQRVEITQPAADIAAPPQSMLALGTIAITLRGIDY